MMAEALITKANEFLAKAAESTCSAGVPPPAIDGDLRMKLSERLKSRHEPSRSESRRDTRGDAAVRPAAGDPLSTNGNHRETR
jgi:hypothetical protein